MDYLGQDEHQYDTRYRFRVRWSIPTRRKPVPRATASVYFTFEVSKIKPKVGSILRALISVTLTFVQEDTLCNICLWQRRQ